MQCKYGHVTDREIFQEWISAANPQWKNYVDELETAGQRPRTNPDGDVSNPKLYFPLRDLSDEKRHVDFQVDLPRVSYDDFVVPECPTCLLEGKHNSVVRIAFYLRVKLPQDGLVQHKPELIFFGESIRPEVRDRSYVPFPSYTPTPC